MGDYNVRVWMIRYWKGWESWSGVWCMVYGFFDRLIGLRSRVCVEGGIEGRVEVGICCRGKEG